MLRALLLTITFALSSIAYSATITKVIEKSSAVFIDEGEQAGFTKGKIVCFYDLANKRVACGKVAKATPKKAAVRISKTHLKDVNTGFLAKIVERKGGKKGEKNEGANKENEASSMSKYNMSISANVHFMLFTPAKYNKIEYLPPETTTPDTFWQNDGSSSSIINPPGFGLEFGMLKWNINAGFRFGSYAIVNADGGYTTDTNSPLGVTTNTKATDLGLYVDYTYKKISGINLGAGLDIDMTSVTLTATQTDSSGNTADNELYSLTSSLTTLSLRLPFTYDLMFGERFGLSASLVLMLPLYAMGPNGTPVVPETGQGSATLLQAPSTTTDATIADPEGDLTASLSHGKNTFGVDAVFGVFCRF